MITRSIDTASLDRLLFQLGSSEITLVGEEAGETLTIAHEFVVGQTVVLEQQDDYPELLVEDGRAIVRQTRTQRIRADQLGAKLRLAIAVPLRLDVEGKVTSGTVRAQNIGNCSVSVSSGTLDVTGSSGVVQATVGSGTLSVRGLERQHIHGLGVASGTITLYAGDLLAEVEADVAHGVVRGAHLGVLSQSSLSGWQLGSVSGDQTTRIVCSIGSGVLQLR